MSITVTDQNAAQVVTVTDQNPAQEVSVDLLQETKDYRDRVEADGGEVIDLNRVDAAIGTLKRLGLYGDLAFLADANMGIRRDSNDAVDKIYDASGGGNDVIQPTQSQKPTLTVDSDYEDRQVVSFDGSDDYLYNENPSISAPAFGVFMALSNETADMNRHQPLRARPNGPFGTSAGIAHGWRGTGTGQINWEALTSPIEDDDGNAYTLDNDVGPDFLAGDTSVILDFAWDSSGAEAWKDGTSTGTGITVENGSLPLGTITLPEVVVGASQVSPPTRFWGGPIASLMIIGASLSAQDRADVRDLIATYYGISL